MIELTIYIVLYKVIDNIIINKTYTSIILENT